MRVDLKDSFATEEGISDMCCRYFMEESPELKPFVEAARRSSILPKMVEKLARPLVTEGEVRPADIVPVLARNRHDQDAVYPMIWGFTRENASALFNARSETAHQKSSFKYCWERRRCIVPASWYYEWEHLADRSGTGLYHDPFSLTWFKLFA